MVLITIEAANGKIPSAPDLPYRVSIPDPTKMTIEDVKKLLSVKFPKVHLSPLFRVPSTYFIHSCLFPVYVVVSEAMGADLVIVLDAGGATALDLPAHIRRVGCKRESSTRRHYARQCRFGERRNVVFEGPGSSSRLDYRLCGRICTWTRISFI